MDVSGVKRESAGDVLSEALKDFLVNKLGGQPRGLRDLGFQRKDVEGLVDGTVPQRRVLMLAPGLKEEGQSEEGREELRGLFEGAMEY